MRTRRSWGAGAVGLLLALSAVAGLAVAATGNQDQTKPREPAPVLDRLPLAFEQNVGQFDPAVLFTARTPGQQVVLGPDGLSLEPAGVRLTLEGATPSPQVVGERLQVGSVNRFVGDDPAAWRTAIPTFGAVTYRQVYPGIDVTFYGTGRLVEHDFLVAPGADPSAIAIGVGGVPARIDGSGALVAGDVRLRAPVLYQPVDGGRRPVEGRFEARGGGRFGFAVGAYDRGRPLVIDPVIVSSSYLGGSSTDTAYAVTADLDGNMFVTGYTESADFPVVGPAQAALAQSDGARTDVFVTKVKADGGTVLWSTYLGGKGRDAAFGVAVGPDRGVWVTGYTESTDFPTVRAVQTASGGTSDVFVVKLNSAGSALDFSTYFGGAGADTGSGIAVTGDGAVVVVGATGSTNFPRTKPIQAALSRPDDVDGFVARFEPNGASVGWSTYLGGAADDHAIDVALDGDGNVYVTGDTRSANFPTLRPFQASPGGAATGGAAGGSFSDAFVTKVKADGTALVWSSYLGGADNDKGTGIAVDRDGAAYVTGNTGSTNFPVLSAAQPKKDGDFDAFVTKVKPDGSGLAYSTYLGGTGSDGAEAVAVDAQGHAYVVGATASANFPTVKGFQSEKGGGFVDAFVTEVAASGASWGSSSYLGGKDDDQAAGVALDRDGKVVVVGYTNSANFPSIKAFQPGKGGGVGDAFITKVQPTGGASDSAAAGSGNGGGTDAAGDSSRKKRIRTLLTITGGLFLAAVLQSVWLRRRPDAPARPLARLTSPDEVDADEPTRPEDLDMPGMKYVPRRGAPALPPIRPPKPIGGRPNWGDEVAKPSSPAAAAPARRRKAGKPVPEEEPVVSRMAAPDLWAGGPESPVASSLAPPDGLDTADLWGPLAADEDPTEWVRRELAETSRPRPVTRARPPEPAPTDDDEWADLLAPPKPTPAGDEPAEAEPVESEAEADVAVEAKDAVAEADGTAAAEPAAAVDADAPPSPPVAARPAHLAPRAVPPPVPAPAPALPPAPLPGRDRPAPGAPADAVTAAAEPAPEAQVDVAVGPPEPAAAPESPEPPEPQAPVEAATAPVEPAIAPAPAEVAAPEPAEAAAPPEPPGVAAVPAAAPLEPVTVPPLPAPAAVAPSATEHPAATGEAAATVSAVPEVVDAGESAEPVAIAPEARAQLVPAVTESDSATAEPEPAAPPEPEPERRSISLRELLDEHLPIPETVEPPAPTELDNARIWLKGLLDEELSIPDPAAVAPESQSPPPQPDEDYVPPPPPRLLRNLFEPDPDDPLVQSLRAREAEAEDREAGYLSADDDQDDR